MSSPVPVTSFNSDQLVTKPDSPVSPTPHSCVTLKQIPLRSDHSIYRCLRVHLQNLRALLNIKMKLSSCPQTNKQ